MQMNHGKQRNKPSTKVRYQVPYLEYNFIPILNENGLCKENLGCRIRSIYNEEEILSGFGIKIGFLTVKDSNSASESREFALGLLLQDK
jgi:hypothetical protein